MNPDFLDSLEQKLKVKILSVKRLSGGDINDAYLIETPKSPYFVKSNSYASGLNMFETEASGLDLIGNSFAIKTPNVLSFGKTETVNYLVLEYIPSKKPNHQSWEQFGYSLAKLHLNSQSQFGLDHHNFIGPLRQRNTYSSNWVSFYINERLQPQIDLAKSKQAIDTTTLKTFEPFFKTLPELCPEEPSALIHGDLWNGNFLIDTNNQPVLIDPAISYSHREMDLAMTYLFGGFSETFYQSYNEVYPLKKGIEERKEIYQLYYLMVHVNLFGGSYLQSVIRILSKYT